MVDLRLELSGPKSWSVIESIFAENEEVTDLLMELKKAYGPDWLGMSPWTWKVSTQGGTE